MPKKSKECPIEILKGKLDNMDTELKSIKENIDNIYETFEEECPDVIESEKALQRALDAYFVEELLKQKPIGDA
jgi:septation ring formation regulator EzrA